MYACVSVSYHNISLTAPWSLEICKSDSVVDNLSQFFKRKVLLSCIAFGWTKFEMVKCCDLSFLSVEAQFMNIVYWLIIC